MNLIIGADVVPQDKIEQLLSRENINDVFGEKLFQILSKADYKIFNLECPLTNSNEKIIKRGPCLKASPEVINGIKKINPTCVLLANNHIMDYSTVGIKDTIELLDKNNIEWVGVGENLNSLKKSFKFTTKDNQIITIYNCCEAEFSIADEEHYGANGYDQYNIDNELKKLKEESNYLILIYHGGKENYRYPSPNLQKRCRKMVDLGADLVVCQHSHCIGCEETYKDKKIIYGQGNFLFNKIQNEYWNTSLLINVDLENFSINYIPIVQHPNGTRLAENLECEQILIDFKKRSKEIESEELIKRNYSQLANKYLDFYLISISNFSFFYKVIKKFFPFVYKKIKFKYAAILNSIECEAHQELFIYGLKNKLKEEKNEK